MSQAPDIAPLVDRHGRIKRRLRVSLTDRCNFRCPYCLPDSPSFADPATLLTHAERVQLMTLLIDAGIRNVRLTGGEPLLSPLLYPSLEALAARRDHGLQRISLTTNGQLLVRHATRLRDAGLDDLNVSLDAIDADAFARMSGGQAIGPVLDGIAAATEAGLPVKLNAVVIRGLNEDQVLPLTEWALAQQLPLRFIEFMPLDSGHRWRRDRVVTEPELLATLRQRYTLSAESSTGQPATYYRVHDHSTVIGVIPTVSRPFCGDCDRLRLTADGTLLPCLFSSDGPALGDLLRERGPAALMPAIRQAVHDKDAGYAARPGYTERPISMHGIGG